MNHDDLVDQHKTTMTLFARVMFFLLALSLGKCSTTGKLTNNTASLSSSIRNSSTTTTYVYPSKEPAAAGHNRTDCSNVDSNLHNVTLQANGTGTRGLNCTSDELDCASAVIVRSNEAVLSDNSICRTTEGNGINVENVTLCADCMEGK